MTALNILAGERGSRPRHYRRWAALATAFLVAGIGVTHVRLAQQSARLQQQLAIQQQRRAQDAARQAQIAKLEKERQQQQARRAATEAAQRQSQRQLARLATALHWLPASAVLDEINLSPAGVALAGRGETQRGLSEIFGRVVGEHGIDIRKIASDDAHKEQRTGTFKIELGVF